MLNRIVLMGRLTRDPELRKTQSDTPVCSFSLAVDRDYKKDGEKKETDFIDIVAWRATAEFVSKFFTKGRMAVVEGVVLRNDACKLHGTAPFRQKIVKIISDIQKNPAVSGICGQDIQKPCTQVLTLCPGCALKSRHAYYIINIGICKILSAGF